MEKNANLHRELGGGAPCSIITGEMGDTKTQGLVKGATDCCRNCEPSALNNVTLVTSSASSPTSSDNACSCIHKSEVISEMYDSALKDKQACGGTSQSADQLSNGMGHRLPLTPGYDGGATSKLENKMDCGSTSRMKESTVTANVDIETTGCKTQGRTTISPPTILCADETSLRNVKSGEIISSDHIASEGPLSGSDPSPVGESRSFDSLDSFSNLNSCPSSDLNSEGLEDRVIANALQSDDYGVDGAKASCAKDRGAGQSMYHIKWIKWMKENTPIITQNENGPCPLLAIMNVLLLAWKVKMPPMMEIITAEQLMEYLGDYILEAKPKEISEAQRLNYEQNMSDAMAVLHKLQTGLDVNVKFTGVRVFEYTPECIVFDLLDIPLYHGWLVDPQMSDIVKAVGNCSYNQLVEKIISCKQSDRGEQAGEGLVAEQFLNSTATQLTYHGLCELTSTVQEGELCVFFRNNHFSTMTKFKGQLYLLVTDQGFLTEEKVVWESLHNVDGDSNFCDSEFRLRPPSDPETVYHGQQDQIDQDYLMALSLQQEQQSQEQNWEFTPEGLSDLELAKKLQEEEDRRASQFYQEQEQAAAAAAEEQGQPQPAGGSTAAGAGQAAAAAAEEEEDGGGGAGGAASVTPSPGKQPSTGERKLKKESKDKDKCVLL
ncbi:ubiquitin carboxyl-terminal hydrolase MINDY-2-like isoform X1 [Anguilla anguilla]|uniref:ubiquitin carboxyl-terminal hydrolase MINDY-2-like isoform X1 n=2 Tax=Anguilla anguilla TaxID=7936 RepID=UPI0015B1B8EC|nr:ubiquitin carboxyl-terminal hydrolase MINDY-2-like isoform X1 [Anguilla anguilla]